MESIVSHINDNSHINSEHADESDLHDIPTELFDYMAYDEQAYRAMLSIPRFARTLTPGRIFDFMKGFGHNVRIERCSPTCSRIVWFRDGKIHKLNGPAVEHTDNSRYWYQNGLLHRDDGPAIIGADGYINWYRHGEQYDIASYVGHVFAQQSIT